MTVSTEWCSHTSGSNRSCSALASVVFPLLLAPVMMMAWGIGEGLAYSMLIFHVFGKVLRVGKCVNLEVQVLKRVFGR